MGTKAARGLLLDVPGDCWRWRVLRRFVISAARVVFPGFVRGVDRCEGDGGVPEPGMPDTAIRRRWDGDRVWYLAVVC